MKLRKISYLFSVFLVALFALFLPCSFSQEEYLHHPPLSEKHVLDNGLTILITELASSPVVSLYALVKAGSATEGEYMGAGISHFLEHMLFKGTEKREVGAIASEIQSLGGTINASTSFDFTIYTITLPKEHMGKGLDILSDMLMNSKFDQEEIDKEREVVYGEMRMRKDNPASYLHELIFRTVYINHPYGIPVIGYESLLAGLMREDFVKYYKTYYTPNCIILSIAGGIDQAEALKAAQVSFKDFKRGIYFPRNVPPEPSQVSQRYYEEEYPTDLTRLTMAYEGVSLFDKDMYALDVLAMLLGQGESSRLYKDLFRDKGIVKSVGASNYTPIDRGAFEITATLDEDKIDTVLNSIKALLEEVKAKGFDEDEINKAKKQVLSDYIFENQTSSSLAYSTATDEAFLGDYAFSKKYVEGIKTVTNQEIKTSAGKYLKDLKLSVIVLRPQKKQVSLEKEKKVSQEEQGIVKYTLPNGLTVLLKENHDFPIISVCIAMHGGTRFENDANNGLSNLTSELWVKGTFSKSAEDIAKLTESLGAHFGNFSGRNSIGIKYEFLSGDVDKAWPILTDIVKNPSFDKDELNKIKDQVKTAIIAKKDNVLWMTGKTLKEALFNVPAFKLDGLGTLESIETITQDDIKNFFKEHAVSNQMVISVFGDFKIKDMKARIDKEYAGLRALEQNYKMPQDVPPQDRIDKEISQDKAQAAVMIGLQAPNLKDRDRYGMELIAAILGSSFQGRIFNRVREEMGEAYTAGGDFTPGLDTGLIYFYALTRDESVLKVKETMIHVIEDLYETTVSEEELTSAKEYLKGNFQMDIETNAALGFTVSLDELYGIGFDNYKQYNAYIDGVTAEDIKRLAHQFLDLKKAVVVVSRVTSKKQ